LPDGTAELRKFVLDVAFIDVSEIDCKLVQRTLTREIQGALRPGRALRSYCHFMPTFQTY
jgi:hypothetical protein